MAGTRRRSLAPLAPLAPLVKRCRSAPRRVSRGARRRAPLRRSALGCALPPATRSSRRGLRHRLRPISAAVLRLRTASRRCRPRARGSASVIVRRSRRSLKRSRAPSTRRCSATARRPTFSWLPTSSGPSTTSWSACEATRRSLATLTSRRSLGTLGASCSTSGRCEACSTTSQSTRSTSTRPNTSWPFGVEPA